MRTKVQTARGAPEEEHFRAALISLTANQGANQKDIARAVGVSQGYVSKILSGRQIPKESLRHRFAGYFGLSYRDMLAMGERELLSGGAYPPVSQTARGHGPEQSGYGEVRRFERYPFGEPPPFAETMREANPQETAAWPYTEIPLREATGSMGGGSTETGARTITYLCFRTEWIRSKGNPKFMSVIRAFGDSMYPSIEDGSVVLVDEGRKQFVRGKVFYIRMNGMMYIKRLVEIGGGIYVASDNDKNMLAVADADDFEIIGRCIWTGRELE